ncbi:LysR family transcriptional regulator [Pseudoroseicyclus aestuarii]|uniref:LysR family transcriptional regulator n=1 Tax=Pseudoroseicyclus aestuarii TaxID=1795041 RepID=A0A318SWL9_9RHOB|nr:LysR family transcriptional regulator [Pseudoroseicyclus aestuarii]PYE85902.1 LysR family transcriptional regulator [Pseudoroseicyclus aestuarii]
MTDLLLRRGLKLAHLRLLAALGETGQIGLAAARLGLTQPAASRLLAEAERIAGHPLRRREGRGIALTEEGAALARRAARVLIEIADAGREMDEIAGGAGGAVRIGSVTGPAMDRVLPMLRSARLSLPDLSIEVEVGTSDLLGDMLAAGRLDLAVARLPAGHDPALFDMELLGPEPVALLVRAGHALLLGPQPTPEALMRYDWILPGEGAILRETVLTRLAELGLSRPPGRIATSSFLLTLALIGRSNAIAPLAASVAARFAGEGSPYRVVPLDLGIQVAPFGIITRASGRLTPAAQRLRALLRRPPEEA